MPMFEDYDIAQATEKQEQQDKQVKKVASMTNTKVEDGSVGSSSHPLPIPGDDGEGPIEVPVKLASFLLAASSIILYLSCANTLQASSFVVDVSTPGINRDSKRMARRRGGLTPVSDPFLLTISSYSIPWK